MYVKTEPGTDWLVVVQQGGEKNKPAKVLRVHDEWAADQVHPLLEMPGRLVYGVTFHPKYEDNGFLFVFSNGPTGQSERQNRISRFTVSRTAPHPCDPESEQVIIQWRSMGHDGGDMEVVTALQQGADDYIRIPCELTELMARVWAILRRAGFITRQEGEKPVRSGELLVNPPTYQVFLGDQRVVLTPTEFKLLHLLVRNRGTVVSHQTLGTTLWGDQVDSSGLVKKYVQRVRRKLGDTAQEPCWIVSIHGTGYRFIGPKEEEEEKVKEPELALAH